jgi:hypothetical protein
MRSVELRHFVSAPRHEDVVGVEVQRHAFLTSALGGGEWSASRLGRFTPREGTPGTHWVGGCVGWYHKYQKLCLHRFGSIWHNNVRVSRLC